MTFFSQRRVKGVSLSGFVALAWVLGACWGCDVDTRVDGSGGNGAAPGGHGGSEPPPLSCGVTSCPSLPPRAVPCCTSPEDVLAARAREAGRCGADVTGQCWELEQPGRVDDECPDGQGARSDERGCCSEEGLCGTMNANPGLGCRYTSADSRRFCAQGPPAVEPDITCELPGIYAARVRYDAVWGGRTGGLFEVIDDGRDFVRVDLMLRVDAAEPGGTLRGSAQLCGIRLPPFYSTELCEAYQYVPGTSPFDAVSSPLSGFGGMLQCAHPGCSFTLDPMRLLQGIELSADDAAWPTAVQTTLIDCPSGSGLACFVDHDADGELGISVAMRADGAPAPGSCTQAGDDYLFRGFPLNADPGAIDAGVQRADRLYLGTRVSVGLAGLLRSECGTVNGKVGLQGIELRVAGCRVQEGTADGSGPAAGPDQPCDETQARLVDRHTIDYALLDDGARPPSALDVPSDVSAGPRFTLKRLGSLGSGLSCADVRNAQY